MEFVYLYAVDGVLLLLLLSTVLRCAHLGLVRAMAGIVAWVAAAAIALHFCAPLSQAVYDRFFQQHVLNMAQENIHNTLDASEVADVTAGVLEDLPEIVVEAAQSVGVDVSDLQKQTTVVLPKAEEEAAAAIEKNVLAPVIIAALKAVLFLVMVMLIAGIAQAMLTPVGKLLHKTPVIGTTDRALGAVLGILKGAVLVSVLAILLQVLGGIVEGGFGEAVQNSRIVSTVAESPFADGVFR